MSKHITVGQASYEAACESRGINSPKEWDRLTERMRFMWKCAGMAAVSAHFASIGARGGGKATPAQAAAARRNGYGNRKSKGKPRPPGNAG